MIKFDIITIFPKIFDSYLKESIISRAQKDKLIKINVYNLRDFAKNRHKTVDDKPFGGGRGMVMKVEPIYRAVKRIKKRKKRTKIILFSPRGKKFNQKMAYQFSKLDQLILICGRYEGVDERVAKHIADEIVSVGDYVLMGGEIPALVVIETIARLIPEVIGKSALLKKERLTKEKGFIEYPQYTRPEVFLPLSPRGQAGKKRIKWPVPKVLLSGNHKKIEEWRKKYSKNII
jgi:tRNA (guanine37-N1)-methyltransferase